MNVFEVTICYEGAQHSEVCVIALDDVTARAKAIEVDAEPYVNSGLEVPVIEYCEIRFVCEAAVA